MCVRMRVCAYIPTLYKKCGYNHDFGYPVTERSSKMLEKDLKILDAGGTAAVVRSVDEVRALIEEYQADRG